jgi:hypothetical protein
MAHGGNPAHTSHILLAGSVIQAAAGADQERRGEAIAVDGLDEKARAEAAPNKDQQVIALATLAATLAGPIVAAREVLHAEQEGIIYDITYDGYRLS